ncbi:MAG: glycosyltransferase 87 family protein [Solirubrobacterales bacterium]
MLAWRLLHDPRLAQVPGWLAPLLPRATGDLDRDPIALLLGAVATTLALLYLSLAAFGARPRTRALVVAAASVFLVIAPTVGFVAMGLATDRPYGQDGGVVQLPLALDKILAGESPYGADYSGTILGRIARASAFWEPYGGNPILRHHAYLPGTHLVMMPFYLLCRLAFGVFDPRFVTLLFYGLAVWLAARLPEGAPARLSAAALVAVNPLVYWHQVFGANDIVFVALLLAAVLLARGGRPVWSAALLGLACATKQLAWPYAPFLLLALAAPKSLADLGRRETWERLLRSTLVAVAVFVVVVLPVAALDFHAFYGDIVAYNVGLPGADNYPLGGTPGFGFANFLIYFGRVASLRDYFPFGVFYVLLIPLGLLLAHRQIREGTPAAALLTGTGALLASLYLSRVVHPNYLVPAAILLPLALLTLRRAPDVALVPLALLAVAVETVTSGVFKEAWQDAVATGHVAVATGLPAWLLPRAGPALTDDPLGLLFGALAAGFAVAALVAGILQAPARVRAGLVVVAAVLVVAVPALVVARIGERTGVPRSENAWVVQAWADAGRLAEGRSPYAAPPASTPRGREAWSSSFRAEPAKELQPDRPLLPPGPATLGRWLWPFGLRDPRSLVLAALVLLALIAAWVSPPEQRPLALGLALLLPALAVGTVFGSPSALPLAGLLGAVAALWAGRGRNDLAAGLGAGVAAGFDHRTLLAAPVLLWSGERRRAILGLCAAYLLLVVPAMLPDPRAFMAAFVRGFAVEPGVGLANLFLYVGGERSRLALAVFAAAPILAFLVVVLTRKAAIVAPLAVTAVVILAGLWLSPSVSPEALAVPIVLAALAAQPADAEL